MVWCSKGEPSLLGVILQMGVHRVIHDGGDRIAPSGYSPGILQYLTNLRTLGPSWVLVTCAWGSAYICRVVRKDQLFAQLGPSYAPGLLPVVWMYLYKGPHIRRTVLTF